MFRPMLATLVDKPFSEKGWIFEVKWDGYRAIAEINYNASVVKLYSRNGKSFNEKFPVIVDELKKIQGEMVLDGEIVALDSRGVASFENLQNYQNKKVEIVYECFDLLFLNGKDLRKRKLIERKQLLRKSLPASRLIRYVDHVENEGIDFYREAEKMRLEGLIAKKENSIYREGYRGTDWLKIKVLNRQEAVICGFTAPRGGRKYLGSLLLGVYEDGRLVYIGRSGGGFDEKTLKELFDELNLKSVKSSPLVNSPKSKDKIIWVRPELVCEVKFTEWTRDGRMRHPVFVGLRPDKNASQVVREIPLYH